MIGLESSISEPTNELQKTIKNSVKELQSLFQAEYDMTSSQTVRHRNKMQYEFAYTNYVQEGKVSITYRFGERNVFELELNYKKAKFENGTKKYHSTTIPYGQIERKTHIRILNDVKRNQEERDLF